MLQEAWFTDIAGVLSKAHCYTVRHSIAPLPTVVGTVLYFVVGFYSVYTFPVFPVEYRNQRHPTPRVY